MPSPISHTGCAFRPQRAEAQTATLRRAEGAQAAGSGDSGKVIVEGAPASTGREARVREAGDYRFFAGWRSDPFFFDRRGALNNLQFTGDDIDRRVSRSRRGNELEIGKALKDVAGQRGPLAHDTNDIKRQQPLNHGVRIGEVVLKYGDVRSIAEHRPIGALQRHILVIVQNSDLVLLHWHPSRGD